MLFDRTQAHLKFIGDGPLRLTLQTMPSKNIRTRLAERVDRLVDSAHFVDRKQAALAVRLRATAGSIAYRFRPMRIAINETARGTATIDHQIVKGPVKIR